MSHKAVVNLVQDVAQSLGSDIQFGYGRKSDFNLIPNKPQTFIWLLPLTASPQYAQVTLNYMKAWNCIVFFTSKDKFDSKAEEYAEVLDEMDTLTDRFIQALNEWENDIVGTYTLRNFQQNPFIKSDASINSGWFVSFQMLVSDTFDYCKNESECLTS